jgi:hypothetical protein
MCTFVVRETVQYYLNKGTDVNAVLLDASKAFDRVHYVKLFRILLAKGLCPLVARFLALMYTQQGLRVKWGEFTSEYFSVSNGVKQGGVLSPHLFNVHLDELLCRLKRSGVGCYIGHIFVGALAYADDIILLAPTRAALTKMLKICSQYSDEYCVNFNPAKSQRMFFGDTHRINNEVPVLLNGQIIDIVEKTSHLGNTLGTSTASSVTKEAIGDMNRRLNVALSLFGKVDCSIMYTLFKSFCTAFYGSQLWDYSLNVTQSVWTAWRKAVRRIFRLNPRTHCYILPFLCGDARLEQQLHARFIKFFHGAFNSQNICVNTCARLCVDGSRSPACNTLNVMSHKYGIGKHDFGHHGTRHFIEMVADPRVYTDIEK